MDKRTRDFLYPHRFGVIPEFMGDFDEVLRSAIRNMNEPYNFTSGLYEGIKQGKKQGFSDGIEQGVKGFIGSGEQQVFVDNKTGESIPFSNNGQLFDDEKIASSTAPIIKDFIIGEKKYFYDQLFNKKMDKYITENNLNIGDNDKYDIARNDLNIKKTEIDDELQKFYAKALYHVSFKHDKNINLDNIKTKLEKKKIDSETQIEELRNGLNSYTKVKVIPPNEKATTEKQRELQNLMSKINAKDMEIINYGKTLEELHILKDKEERFRSNNYFIDKENQKSLWDYEMESLKKKKNLKDAFRDYKNDNTAILLTDTFTIHDTKKIRNLYNNEIDKAKEKGAKTIIDKDIIRKGKIEIPEGIVDKIKQTR